MVEKRKRTPEARRASAQKYTDRCIRLGMMFHTAQQESFDGWASLDEWADGHRWDEALGGKGIETAEFKESARAGVLASGATMLKEFSKRLRQVEPWMGSVEQFASPMATTDTIAERVIHIEELSHVFKIQPYIRIDVHKTKKKVRVRFMLERTPDPKSLGRYLKPKPGAIVISLIRPTQEAIVRQLGGYVMGAFKDFTEWVTLDAYEEGEEARWKAEVSFDIQAPQK